MCESVGDFYDYLHEILDKHEANYNVEDGKFHISERGSEGRDEHGHFRSSFGPLVLNNTL